MNKYTPFKFRPCADTISNYKKIWKGYSPFVEKDFENEYVKHLAGAHVVVESAKIYAEANWKRVRDWSELDVEVTDNTGKTTHYYSYKKRMPTKPKSPKNGEARQVKIEAVERILNRMEQKRKSGHNPVNKVTGLCLDPSDGDFSIEINGKPHLWINGEAIITNNCDY